MRYFLVAVMACWLLNGCSHNWLSQEQSLYQQLGGREGIQNLVYELIVNIADDERIVDHFRGVDIERFKAGLETYICSVSDGPCEYTGEPMDVVHGGHNITHGDFNALVENLIEAMEELALPVAAQNRLLAELATEYDNIVYQ